MNSKRGEIEIKVKKSGGRTDPGVQVGTSQLHPCPVGPTLLAGGLPEPKRKTDDKWSSGNSSTQQNDTDTTVV